MHDMEPLSCPNCSHVLDFSEGPRIDTENRIYTEIGGSRTIPINSDTVMSRMDATLTQMDRLIETLVNQRAVVSRSRNQYTHAARLPVEILSEIFRWTFRVSGQDSIAYPGPTTLPLLLGKICSEWRNIAWGLSELWETFHCSINQYKILVQKTLLKEWIDRSGTRLLSIRLSPRNRSWDYSDDGQTHIIEALIPHCRRWKSIDFTFPETWYEALENVKGKLDNLTSLKLCPPGDGFIIKSLKFFSDAPLLRSITSAQYYLSDLEYPWSQLTVGSFRSASVDEAIEILSRCPNLVSCRFDDLSAMEGHFSVQDVIHTNIQQLTVKLNVYHTLSHFLDLLILPSLSFLGLILPDVHPIPLDTVHTLIQRSECPSLKTIQIIGIDIPSTAIINFLVWHHSVLNFNNKPSHDIQEPRMS